MTSIKGFLSIGAARLLGVVIGAGLVAVVAACGTDSQSGSEQTLASWRDSACSSVTSMAKALEPEPTSDEDDTLLASPETSARHLEAMRSVLAELRKLPLPTQADHRTDAEKFVEMIATMVKSYEEAMPRIEAASRRFDRVLKSAVDDDTPLPPAPEGSTVAGGIMEQMMSIPGVRDAWTELMAAYGAAIAGIDEKEADRLEKALGLEQCEEPEDEERASAGELARCGARGSPVSSQRLVEIFRASDISLEIDERTCVGSVKDRVQGARPDATNAGPSGLSQSDELNLKEGHVLCYVDEESSGDDLEIIKYDTDTETTLSVQNVSCTIYPHSTSTEAPQIARVKKAMKAVAAEAGRG